MEADAALRSQIFAYRSIVRGIAPPPEAFEHVHPNMGQPPLDSAALIEAEFSAESELAKGLQAHQHALCDVPADLPAPIRVPLAVERHLPGLLPMQRALRAEIGGYCDRSRLVEEATASLALRRARRTRQPRELRDAERTERKRATEAVRGCTRPAHLEHRTPPFSASLTVPLPPAHLASRWPNILHAIATSCLPCLRQDTARKRLRDEFLLAVAMHTDEFRGFHRDVRKGASRLGKAVLASFDGKARKEKRDGERAQRERLRALKENNMEEYMKLVSDSKNERITQLLKETDNYLAELGDKVRLQKQAVAASGAGGAGTSADGASAAPMLQEESAADKYSERSQYYKLAHTVGERIETQPAMLQGGQLKEYQLSGLRWLVSLHNNNLNGILADEMGLGKTIQTIALIAYLIESKQLAGPYLVIVPLATLSNWQLEFGRWSPSVSVIVYKGAPEVRRELFENEMLGKADTASVTPFNVVLTTYELVMKDKAKLKKWRYSYIIIDEGHRMKNAASKLSATLLQYDAAHRILLTGTPLQNSLGELWALLNFLLPKIFSSADTFDSWFSAPLAAAGGGSEDASLTEEETLLVINRLHQVLRPFLLRRMKSEVESQLPGKAEYVLKCELSCMQKLMYRQIQGQGLCTVGSGGQLKVSGLNNVEMQLRKVCNHPYLHFNEEQYNKARQETPEHIWRSSGKFELLARILPKLQVLRHRVLIFSQMVKLMDLLQDHLKQYGVKHLRLDGHTKGDERGELLHTFNNDDSYSVFLLSTRAGGQGLNLQSADTVIIFDSDWNPQMDLQAMARAHRIGQKTEVRVLRLITASPIEEKILATANEKLDQEAKIIEAGKFNQTSDASERRETLQKLLAQSADDTGDEACMPTDEDINEMLARPNPTLGLTREEEVVKLNEMDAERMREEEERSRATGGSTVRLLMEEELPKWLGEAELLAQQTREAADVVDGPRERKATSYGGNELSERDFTRFMQSGLELDQWQRLEEVRKKKLEEKANNAAAAAATSSDSGAKPPPPKKARQGK
jgi:ATP-dependent helicase STH1/SNF2